MVIGLFLRNQKSVRESLDAIKEPDFLILIILLWAVWGGPSSCCRCIISYLIIVIIPNFMGMDMDGHHHFQP